jgi:hypothetical protein
LITFKVLTLISFEKQSFQASLQDLKQITGIFLVIFQIVTAMNGLAETYGRREDTVRISASMLSEFPPENKRVLVPYRFVFNQLPEKQLVSYKTMEYHQVESGKKFSKCSKCAGRSPIFPRKFLTARCKI